MSSFCHEYINEKLSQLLGRQGDKPLELCQCNNGVSMHISSIAITSFSIKSPLIEIRRAKKKLQWGSIHHSLICHSIISIKVVIARTIISNINKWKFKR